MERGERGRGPAGGERQGGERQGGQGGCDEVLSVPTTDGRFLGREWRGQPPRGKRGQRRGTSKSEQEPERAQYEAAGGEGVRGRGWRQGAKRRQPPPHPRGGPGTCVRIRIGGFGEEERGRLAQRSPESGSYSCEMPYFEGKSRAARNAAASAWRCESSRVCSVRRLRVLRQNHREYVR